MVRPVSGVGERSRAARQSNSHEDIVQVAHILMQGYAKTAEIHVAVKNHISTRCRGESHQTTQSHQGTEQISSQRAKFAILVIFFNSDHFASSRFLCLKWNSRLSSV